MGKLGQLLVARGWITVQQLTRALKNQNVAGGRLGTCLLEMDAISEDLLSKGLSEHLGVPAASVEDLRGIPEEVLRLIPEKLARRCRAVPFHVEGGRLDVALLDPRNLSAQDELAFASGKRVKVHVAQELRILESLEKSYGEECPSRFAMVIERLNRARYFWERQAAQEAEEKAAPAGQLLPPLDDVFAPSPRLAPPPPLPESNLPPSPRRAQPAPAAAPPRPAPPAPVAKPAPAAAPVPAPAARPLSVALTAEERVALGAAPPEIASIEAAEKALAEAGDFEEAGRILLGFLSRGWRRVALFRVIRDRVTGWMAEGADVDRNAFPSFSLGFDQPSLFLNLRNGSGLHLGPLPPMPAHRQLAQMWGGELPRECVVLPVRLKDRLVTILYADSPAKGLGGVDLSSMQRLTLAAAAAFERFALRKRAESKS
jgi:Type II secretion system (T2SS), protein E, N-terminal domain